MTEPDRSQEERIRDSHEEALRAAKQKGKAIVGPHSSWPQTLQVAAALLGGSAAMWAAHASFGFGELGLMLAALPGALLGFVLGVALTASIFVVDESLEPTLGELTVSVTRTTRETYFDGRE